MSFPSAGVSGQRIELLSVVVNNGKNVVAVFDVGIIIECEYVAFLCVVVQVYGCKRIFLDPHVGVIHIFFAVFVHADEPRPGIILVFRFEFSVVGSVESFAIDCRRDLLGGRHVVRVQRTLYFFVLVSAVDRLVVIVRTEFIELLCEIRNFG